MLPVLILFGLTVAGVVLSVVFRLSIRTKHGEIALYWVCTLVGAAAAVMLGYAPLSELRASFLTDSAVNPLKILVLFFSMTAISIFLDEAGFYSFLACALVHKAGTSQKRLFFILFAMVSVLTVFTSNDIIILTFTPFILYFSNRSNINPVPYIFGEFVAANTWSMFFVFGNPTNIYIASAFGIDFVTYAKTMIPVTVLAGVSSLTALYLLFRKSLRAPIQAGGEETVHWNRPLSGIGLTFLGLCVVCMALASYVGLEMWLVAFVFAAACMAIAAGYLIFAKKSLQILKNTVGKLPWTLAPFLLSMFVLIVSLNHAGVIQKLAGRLPDNVFAYGLASFAAANVLNNIPMSVLFTSLLSSAHAGIGDVYAVIMGSNLGALLTPVGALAGIMWLNIVKEHSVRFSFFTFVKYGELISVPALLTAMAGLILL